ncbi:alpha/beta fold hydrolase [Desemzia sp. RIT804]|uniref:alpha/beta hydrolase n=1 Tax=Desemzia sp. RIT 804 TaxID=2810209 RepID=UPI001952372E|nr:alpha/beta fold hydrolase [Desemzia sp. RIT 804]MBM6615708.1 alpha/beta fold hydrolase [Desemzia sp. RIT 804]
MRDRSFYFKGGERAVLLFHAYSSTPNDVRMLGRALERANYAVYSPTFKGHGTHDLEDILEVSPNDWINDAKEALQFLSDEGHQEVVAFGLSLGGIIATKLMLEEDLIASGTFSSPAINNETSNVRKEFLEFMIAKKRKNGDSEESIQKRLPALEEKLDKQLASIRNMVDEMAPHYGTVEKPIFIAQGGNDELINSNIAYELRDAFTNAAVDFHWYENSPHSLTVGPDRKEFEQDVLNFLTKLQWNGG